MSDSTPASTAHFRVLDGGDSPPPHSLVAVNGNGHHPSPTSPPLKASLLSPSHPSPIPSRSSRPAIPVLTGVRGLLAIWILLHNTSGNLGGNVDQLPEWTTHSGSAAVTAFFVLSGLIMAYNYGDHRFDTRACYLSFLGKRYGRMLPLYYLSMLMCLGVVVNQLRTATIDVWTWLHWLALALAINTWVPWPTSGSNGQFRQLFAVNPVLWSLQTELGFYVAFPLFLRVLRRLLSIPTLTGIGRGEASVVDRRARHLLALLLLFSALTIVPTLLLCYGPGADRLAYLGSQYQCYGDWAAVLYTAPWIRFVEFVLGMLVAALYLLTVEAGEAAGEGQGEAGGEAQASAPTGLVRFLSSSAVLHSPWLLAAYTVGLSLLLVYLPSPGWDVPGRQLVFALNPGSFALGFALLYLLLLNTRSPLKPTLPGYNPVGYLFTHPAMVRMGEVSFAFYSMHYVPLVYAQSIGQRFPSSGALAFAAALGLALPSHYHVEVPCYQWASRALPKCDCHDDHQGLKDLHAGEGKK